MYISLHLVLCPNVACIHLDVSIVCTRKDAVMYQKPVYCGKQCSAKTTLAFKNFHFTGIIIADKVNGNGNQIGHRESSMMECDKHCKNTALLLQFLL